MGSGACGPRGLRVAALGPVSGVCSRSMTTVHLDGDSLTLAQIRAVAFDGAKVELTPDSAKAKVQRARDLVDQRGRRRRAHLRHQHRLRHPGRGAHRQERPEAAAAQPDPLATRPAWARRSPLGEARALLLLRANVLAKGYSGIRLGTLELALADAQPRRHPGGPRAGQRGRLGRSGAARAPGAGADRRGRGVLPRRSACRAPRRSRTAGLQPVVLEAKEGLTLVNGTQAMCAVGVPALLARRRRWPSCSTWPAR